MKRFDTVKDSYAAFENMHGAEKPFISLEEFPDWMAKHGFDWMEWDGDRVWQAVCIDDISR